MEYAKRPDQRQLYGSYSMTMCLIKDHPHFLHIEEDWVEMLLKAEMHIKNEHGDNCLMILFLNDDA